MWQPFVVVLLAVRVHVGGIAWIPRWGMLMPEVSSFAWIFNEQYLHSIVQLQVTSFLDVEVGQPESAAWVRSWLSGCPVGRRQTIGRLIQTQT